LHPPRPIAACHAGEIEIGLNHNKWYGYSGYAFVDPVPRLWPATDIVPFPYPHPVTGEAIVCDIPAREGFKD
jgi:hypothetical protein